MQTVNVIIICVTILLAIVYITFWLTYMARRKLPCVTVGTLEPKPEQPAVAAPTNAIGFVTTSDTSEDKVEERSDKEEKETLLKDVASTVSSLLRGEVDFDDIRR